MNASVTFPCPVCKVDTELNIKAPKVLTPTVQWARCDGRFGGGCKSEFLLRISKSRDIVGNVEFYIVNAKLSEAGDKLFQEQKRNANPPPADNRKDEE